MTKAERKAQLQAELEELEQEENNGLDVCIAEIMKLPEAKQLQELCFFNQEWEMQVLTEVICDFRVTPFRDKYDGYSWGTVSVNTKEPKGYNIEPFFFEDDIGSVNMQSDMPSLSPEVNQQFKQLRAAEKALQKKATPIAKKHGYSWDDVVDLVCENIQE